MAEQTAFESWVVLELMGRRRLAGYLREIQIAGADFLRIDVPGATGTAATQFYAPSAVYCITPTTEATAREVAEPWRVAPVQRWELPAARVRDDDVPDFEPIEVPDRIDVPDRMDSPF